MTSAFQFGAFQQSAWQSSVATVADAFQPNAFQDDAFQTTVYDDAFQRCAFQETGFQTSACPKPDVLGGGPGGWGRERAVLEWSIRERLAQQTLQKSQSKPARRIAKAMEDYSSERIAFDELRLRTVALARQLERQQGLAADLRQAARDIRQFIEDEQDALDAILLADAHDAEVIAALILH